MCSGSKRKPTQSGFTMEGQYGKHEVTDNKFSVLLEFSALNDLIGFKNAVEQEGHHVDEVSLWYGRRVGSKKMGFEDRTPLMIAAMFGSKDVLSYILKTGCDDVNRTCGSDGPTALHCAVAGGSASSPEVVKLLLDASADANSVDANGNRPCDLIGASNSTFNSRKRVLQFILKGGDGFGEASLWSEQTACVREEQQQLDVATPRVSKDGAEKKDYPIDLSLPDINNGIYSTDEFRMYTFKVKPCSRAYSHDWTECPFVHPGENARRRDPQKYHYSCVPCPEFRKGSCRQGDACEYAHGIFECWLHPAQYRTRLCKDETGCTRRVCFFAHKLEELRPLYASTGSAVPSPRSFSATSSLELGSLSPRALGSSSVLLPGSRLKTALNARDIDLEIELIELENQRRQHLIDAISNLSSPSRWNNAMPHSPSFVSSGDQDGKLNRFGGMKPTNLEDIFGSLDPLIFPQLQGLSVDAVASQLQSPTGIQMQQNGNQQLQSYSTCLATSPVTGPPSPSFGVDKPSSMASVLNSRSAAFAKRSQSFIERSVVNRHSGISSPTASAAMRPSTTSDWGSPDGKLDWGMQREELNKLRKSASFGFRSYSSTNTTVPATANEPDVHWVHSIVKDDPPVKSDQFNIEKQHQRHLNNGTSDMLPAWLEQLYMEQEQITA
ncbi:Zinc finger CCCH domain-containing protein [Quillaja saponaria]|uniref:Zinc finger CCCH domain-containing protein n=1 Tax=Quillaja saponaria TaxID=32244 RepID=A0AAD7PQI8_QUISA|nr:Zinc finger CCCH domain-containing protein [Quillaja saponaria]